MTNFCFEIRVNSDLDELKVQKKHPKPIWIKFRLVLRLHYLFTILYPRTISDHDF